MEFLFLVILPTAVSAAWGFAQVIREKRFIASIPATPSSTHLDTETHIYRTQEGYNHYDTGSYR
jgi:hypothetical protein